VTGRAVPGPEAAAGHAEVPGERFAPGLELARAGREDVGALDGAQAVLPDIEAMRLGLRRCLHRLAFGQEHFEGAPAVDQAQAGAAGDRRGDPGVGELQLRAVDLAAVDPHRALVTGPSRLYGETITSPDIRAGMGMLLAALAADGSSVINNIGQIERGYERIDERLRALGAEIERVD